MTPFIGSPLNHHPSPHPLIIRKRLREFFAAHGKIHLYPRRSSMLRPPEAFKVCQFPKHSGKQWTQVLKDDPDFILWLLGWDGPDLDPELEEYLTELYEEEEGFLG